MWEDMDFEESYDGEEGEEATFPLSFLVGISIFSLLIACKSWTSESTLEIWTLGLTGGGRGNDILGQP
jgi:hypothetical protein